MAPLQPDTLGLCPIIPLVDYVLAWMARFRVRSSECNDNTPDYE